MGERFEVDSWTMSLYRSIAGVAVILAFFAPKRQVEWKALVFKPHLVARGLLGAIGIPMFYYTVIHLGAGKGTLIIVPNDSLTKYTIENFTGAKKVISIISLVFYRHLPDQEKALIRQVILDCTKDIFGIDARNTKVDFIYPTAEKDNNLTHAKVSFFILGSGEVSMDLRQQLLDIAQQNMNRKLKEYGIDFDLKEQTINIDSPITI